MNMKKYHQICYLKISSNLLFENIIKFVFFAILVAFICDGGAGRGGCGGSSATAGGAGEMVRDRVSMKFKNIHEFKKCP